MKNSFLFIFPEIYFSERSLNEPLPPMSDLYALELRVYHENLSDVSSFSEIR